MTGKEIVGLIEKLKPFGLLDTQINDIIVCKNPQIRKSITGNRKTEK